MVGRSGGAIMDFTAEHYFADLPLRLSLELAPLALAVEGDGTGAIGHLRLGAAFSTDHVEIGASAGTRLQNYGGSGISMAGFLRLGRLDGLKLTMTYGYVLARNQYTGIPIVGLSNAMATVDIPLSVRTALFFEAGGSGDLWVYGSGGSALPHRRIGRPQHLGDLGLARPGPGCSTGPTARTRTPAGALSPRGRIGPDDGLRARTQILAFQGLC